MGKQQLIRTGAPGGASQFKKSGTENSARFIKGLDIHSDPDYISPSPSAVRDDLNGFTGVTSAVKWGVDAQPYNPDLFFYGSNGNIYRVVRGSPNDWNLDHTNTELNNGNGLVVYQNYLYYAGNKTIGRVYVKDSVGTYDDDFTGSNGLDLDITNPGTITGSTYNLPAAISETTANTWSLNPSASFSLKDPQHYFKYNITAKGTGNWTCVVHDSNNTVIASKTVTNVNLPASGIYNFTFDTCWEALPDEAYHVHLISTVGDGFVESGTLNNFSTVNGRAYFCPLIETTDCHPMVTFRGQLVIGNEKYLATWNGSTYNPNTISIDPDYRVTSISRDGEYLVAAAQRGTGTNKTQAGRLYYWDGISPLFNFSRDVSVGVPQAIFNYKNKLYVIAGDQSQIYLGTEPLQQIYSWQYLSRTGNVEVACQPIAEWGAQMQMGFCELTDDASYPQGVYQYGHIYDSLPESMSLNTIPSHGIEFGTTIGITMVASMGDDLYVGWYNGVNYGVDLVNRGNPPSPTSSFETLIFDAGQVMRTKLSLDLVVTHDPLPAGCTITPKYRTERQSTWVYGPTNSTVGSIRSEFSFPGVRFREIEFGWDATTTDYYDISGFMFQYNNLDTEDVIKS